MALADVVLLDTDVLIEIIRKNVGVIRKCDEIGRMRLAITSISRSEFLKGSRDKESFSRNKKFISNFQLLRMNESIDEIFTQLYEKYSLEHRPGIPDMIIAATALHHKFELYTLNKKDFQFIPALKLVE